ncbi:MAG: RNA polymerase sigma factor [Clostridia bacterium]|nr:RNA polymerase sigma factor [Clostridia bacterium]
MKQGNRDAFDQIYADYHQKILRMAYLIIGNQADSEDITQEVFIKCYTNCRQLKENAKFSPWLYQILTHTAWRYAKRKSKEIPDDELVKSSEHTDGINSLDLIMESEQAARICAAIRQLNIKYRLVIIYYYYNQFSIKEISVLCNCLEGTVKSRLHKARQLLKSSLIDIDLEEDHYEKESETQFHNTGFVSGI